MNNKITVLIIFIITYSSLAAQFNIEKFSTPNKYGWTDLKSQQFAREELFERQKLLQIYEMERHSLAINMLQSAVVPGWGQFNTKHYTSGQVFLALELIIAGTSYYFYDRSSEKYALYLDATYIGDIDQYYEDASTFNTYSKGLMMLGIAIWAYNLYDTFQGTEEYNAGLWDKIMKEYNNKNIQVSIYPLGFEVKF